MIKCWRKGNPRCHGFTAILVAGMLAIGALSSRLRNAIDGRRSRLPRRPSARAGRGAGSSGAAAAAAPARRRPPRRAPAPTPPPAPRRQPRAAAPAAGSRRPRGQRRRRPAEVAARPPPPPPPPPPSVMPKPVDADRLGDRAVARSARRPQGRLVGRRRGRVEHEHDLDDAADGQGAGRDALGPRLLRQVRDPGQLQRLRHLRHLQSRRSRCWRRRTSAPRRRTTCRSTRTCCSCRRRRPTAAPTAASAACPIRSARIACAASASSTSRTSATRSWWRACRPAAARTPTRW